MTNTWSTRSDPNRPGPIKEIYLPWSFLVHSPWPLNRTQHNTLLSSVKPSIQKTQNTIEYSFTILFYSIVRNQNNGRSKKRANRWRWISCRNSFCWRFWWCTSLHSRISLHALSSKRINHFLPLFSCVYSLFLVNHSSITQSSLFFTLLFVFSSFIHDERINFFNTMCAVACFSIPGFNNLLASLFLFEFGFIVFIGFNFTASSD